MLFLVVVPVWFQPVSAGTAGKIAGTISDVVTGKPLPGAKIVIQGTQIITEADADGEFYIINLPVGNYVLNVSIPGYESTILKDVRVLMDLTTPIDLAMQTSIPSSDTAAIHARQPRIEIAQQTLTQRDRTSSGATLTQENIVHLANSRSIADVLSNVSGTNVDVDGNIHVRGGRTGSVTYLLDGFQVQDPFTGENGLPMPPGILEELTIVSGGLMPEYGQALSGVVSALTREGSDRPFGRIKSYGTASPQYDVARGNYKDLKQADDYCVIADVSGPLAKIGAQPATIFGGAELSRENGYLPHSRQERFSGTGKFVMYPTTKAKVTFNGAYYFEEQQLYTHRFYPSGLSYDFNLDGLGKKESESYLAGFTGEYNQSANTVLSVNVNHFRTKSKTAPEQLFDLNYRQWPGYFEDGSGNYDSQRGTIDDSNYHSSSLYGTSGFTSGNDFYPVYKEQFAAYSGARLLVLTQLNKNHQLKLGSDWRYYELFWDRREFLSSTSSGETYDTYPWSGAAYVQDKMEFRDLVVNIGLRLDYFYSNVSYWNDPLAKDYTKQSKAKINLAPRLGISHPISENAVLHFNYGYVFQAPQATSLYTNLEAQTTAQPYLMGNPDLKAERVVYYELGLSRLINNSLRLNLTTYYKDQENLVGIREFTSPETHETYVMYTNADYGSVKGFDLSIESVNHDPLNWFANYSYMLAQGNASNPDEYLNRYYIFTGNDRPPLPATEYPLSFDRNHKLVIGLDLRAKRGQHFKVAGISLPDAWGINLLGTYGSGLPYTKTDQYGKLLGFLNGQRMPYTLRLDLCFNKDFYLSQDNSTVLSFYAIVENLFDRRNVVSVYSTTGKPDNDGATVANSQLTGQERLWHELIVKDPQHYDMPRQLRMGLECRF